MAAAFAKPTMFRQAAFSIPARRGLATSSIASKPLFTSSSNPTTPFLRQSNAALRSRTLGALPKQTRVAAFHASARRDLLPPGPQVIEGTTNDPAPIPEPEPMHGSYHWSFERLMSVALVPLTVAPFAAGTLNPTLDALFVASMIIHSHIGFQSILIDYIPWKRYPTLRKVMFWALRLATLLCCVGMYEFETHDVGVTEAIKRIWKA